MSDPPLWFEPTDEEERTAPRVNNNTFWEAMQHALGAVLPTGEGGSPGLLADYIASEVPLTRNDRLMLADFLRLLSERKVHGERGARRRGRSDADEAKYQLARRVLDQMRVWREQNPTQAGRLQRVPLAKQTDLIKADIATGTSPLHHIWRQRLQSCDETIVDDVLRLLRNRSRL